jgi:hypothetical protein
VTLTDDGLAKGEVAAPDTSKPSAKTRTRHLRDIGNRLPHAADSTNLLNR